jgi:hypothetical protein
MGSECGKWQNSEWFGIFTAVVNWPDRHAMVLQENESAEKGVDDAVVCGSGVASITPLRSSSRLCA